MPVKEYKIAVFGGSNSGVTGTVLRFEESLVNYEPIIEGSNKKLLDLDGEQYVLEILHTAGTEQFTAMRDLYMKIANGFVLVYSITERSTYNSLDTIYNQIVKIRDTKDVPIIVVGNKCDLESQRAVSQDDGKALADKYGADFLEVSVKYQIRISDILTTLIKRINSSNDSKKPDHGPDHRSHCSLV
ncbi:hypothetical protein, conserved [Entamoeba dispar SAW760]|uniref:Uncharacterized protein n=1 Tax=Entamoeba dispar (strain ATCC PRA-260 / SAW760) TaxID=370354 RepID=B0EGL3_ENTDS|nr:uncharacterized protein EDI_041020 [Entamoeba dispar SAW760]EDR26334.1 hypothetical protein, conserved [Entamoeba dispar SAW760]|eukprot:EDR26334.1 hypothetical protein, conserved [Entamoeba dispar SAW760]